MIKIARDMVQINTSLNVRSRVNELALWEDEFNQQYEYLTRRLKELDRNKRHQAHRIVQIMDYREMIRMWLAKEPLGIERSALDKGYPVLHSALMDQYPRLSASEKLLWLNNLIFIETPEVKDMYKKFDNVREYRAIGQKRNFLIGGPSGMGKTAFLNQLTFRHLPIVEEERNYVPIAKVKAPSNSAFGGLLKRLMLEFGLVYLAREDQEDMMSKVIASFGVCDTEILVVDEIGDLDHTKAKRGVIDLSNRSPRVIMVGAAVSPHKWLQGDAELAGRFNDQVDLVPFKGVRLRQLLSYIELVLPFAQPSNLAVDEILTGEKRKEVIPGPAKLIEEWTGGIFREIMALIVDASKRAIKEDLPCLTPTLLEKTWRAIQSRPPSSPDNNSKEDSES